VFGALLVDCALPAPPHLSASSSLYFLLPIFAYKGIFKYCVSHIMMRTFVVLFGFHFVSGWPPGLEHPLAPSLLERSSWSHEARTCRSRPPTRAIGPRNSFPLVLKSSLRLIFPLKQLQNYFPEVVDGECVPPVTSLPSRRPPDPSTGPPVRLAASARRAAPRHAALCNDVSCLAVLCRSPCCATPSRARA